MRQTEPLELRRLLAAVSWTGQGDGVNWDSVNNWSTHSVPTINDDVTINVAASDPTITIRTNANCRSLSTFENMYLSYPGHFLSFKVATIATINREFRVENVMDGGSWNGPGKIRILNSPVRELVVEAGVRADIIVKVHSAVEIRVADSRNGDEQSGAIHLHAGEGAA